MKRGIKDIVSKRSQIDLNQAENTIQIDPNMRHLVGEISSTVGGQINPNKMTDQRS